MTVPRETCGTDRPRLCRRCRKEPRRPGQRYGKKCHAEMMKKYRAAAAERQRALAWELAELRKKAS
jgi:hypothetical protein